MRTAGGGEELLREPSCGGGGSSLQAQVEFALEVVNRRLSVGRCRKDWRRPDWNPRFEREDSADDRPVSVILSVQGFRADF